MIFGHTILANRIWPNYLTTVTYKVLPETHIKLCTSRIKIKIMQDYSDRYFVMPF